ncbi:MAG: hypothetical protein F6K28_49750 [Microcoleus sp. SIO2G3]|nr:hypothetical protein [Microcoleus sp. SIO2G3]
MSHLNVEAAANGLECRVDRSTEQYFWRQAKAFPTLTYVGCISLDGTALKAAPRPPILGEQELKVPQFWGI